MGSWSVHATPGHSVGIGQSRSTCPGRQTSGGWHSSSSPNCHSPPWVRSANSTWLMPSIRSERLTSTHPTPSLRWDCGPGTRRNRRADFARRGGSRRAGEPSSAAWTTDRLCRRPFSTAASHLGTVFERRNGPARFLRFAIATHGSLPITQVHGEQPDDALTANSVTASR